MNIALKTFSGHYIVRPDTTWEKDNDDLFLPEFVDSVSFTPVVFCRMSRAGRSIQKQFANRYWDSFGHGVLIYADTLEDGSPEGFAQASSLDHTSFLAIPLYLPVVLGNEGNRFILSKNGEEIFSTEAASAEMFEEAIAGFSSRTYLRRGDFMAIELDERRPLAVRADGKCSLTGTYCSNTVVDFNIIF